MWTKILKAGEETGEHGPQRIKENMISAEKCDPPPLYALRKDHKIIKETEEKGPPTRPVCGAAAAHNGKLSHLLSMVLKEVKKLDENSCESTEDILSEIEELNQTTLYAQNEKLVVGSLDVKALYPSLDIPFTAKIVANEFLKSEVNIEKESVDYRELGIYLILSVSEEELQRCGLREYCPTRISNRGRKPTMTGQAGGKQERRDKIWNPPKEERPDETVVKRMLSKALEVGIKMVMTAHVYKFRNEIKKQVSGGAIGLELTGELAGVFMMWWDNQLQQRLRNEGIDLKLYKRYVDDINIIVKTTEAENDKKIVEGIKVIGNNIHPSIQLEADFPSKYSDNKLPILDLKVWIEDNKILHEYYSKSVASKSVVHNRSAMSLKDKRTVITQDILRVLLRCSPTLPWENIKQHIDEYTMRLQFSGYSEQFRKQVVRSAIIAHERIKEKVENGERPLYRRRKWKQNERAKSKRSKKENWYKQKVQNEEKEYMSVLFVQPTEGSVLRKKYEEVIEKSTCNVKVVERAGMSIKRQIQNSYPFEQKVKCGDKCFVCVSGGKGNCRRSNVNYEIECMREGCEYVYIGETGRNAYCRGMEHLKGLERKESDSVLAEHIVSCHGGVYDEPPCHKYRMSVTQYHVTTLDRQVTEAVKIDTTKRPTLNRKRGYRTNRTLRLGTSLSPK